MVKFAVSFIAGIIAFNFIPFFPVTIAAACCLSAVVPAFRQRKYPDALLIRPAASGGWRAIMIIPLVVSFGFLYSFARHNEWPEPILPEHDAVIEGTVACCPAASNEKLVFTIDSIKLEGRRINGRVRLVVYQDRFMIKSAEDLVLPGSRVSAVASLKRPYVFRNPGVYSFGFKKNGIVASGYVKQIRILSEDPGVPARIYKKRLRLGRIMDNSLTTENSSLLKAIIPGFKAGLGQDMRDAFSSTGLAHLLSISGTHFGLLAFIVFIIIKTAIKKLPASLLSTMTLYITPTQIAVLTTMPVLVSYALISGGSAPTVRSLLMVSIYMLALFLGRRDQWLNSLSIAAVIILLWQPDALFELSFILSFLAVLSIGYVMEYRTQSNRETRFGITDFNQSPSVHLWERGAGWIIRVFEKAKTAPVMTIAAVLGTAPVVAIVFKQFPIISPVTNIIITPIICFLVLPLGFFAGFWALIFDMPVMPLNGLIDMVTGFALRLIEFFAGVPYSNIHVHTPPFALTALYYLSLLYILSQRRQVAATRSREVKKEGAIGLLYRGRNIVRIGPFLPFLLVIGCYLAAPYLSDSNFRVTFLDAGQGDASVVELPDGKVMLIDGSVGKPDMGKIAIAPFLWSRGIRKIDYIVLSHPHPDHYGGLIYILDNFDIGEIWLSGRFIAGANEFFEVMNRKNVSYKILGRGDMLEAEGYNIYVFHPYNEYYSGSVRGEHTDHNNDSLVMKIETDETSVIFTGDIEKEAEENLAHLGAWLDSDILKVPHHGSRTSSSEYFINAVSPQVAIVSAGMNNPFGHPHKEILDRYYLAGVRLLRTDLHGAVAISAAEGMLKVTTYDDRRLIEVSDWRDEMRNLGLLFLKI